jgi:hypothetical protein
MQLEHQLHLLLPLLLHLLLYLQPHLQQQDPLHGRRRRHVKVLLHIGLWGAAVAVQGHMIKGVTEAEAEVLPKRARML